MGNFKSKSSKNGREIHMIPTHSCSFAYKTYYFLFLTFVCFCFCVVVLFCYCCCCFLRSCCCRVVGSRSESENVAKKWIYVLPVFIAVITISKVGVQKTIKKFFRRLLVRRPPYNVNCKTRPFHVIAAYPANEIYKKVWCTCKVKVKVPSKPILFVCLFVS